MSEPSASHGNEDQNSHSPPRRKRTVLKRVASKLFGRHKESNNGDNSTSSGSSSSSRRPTSRNPSPPSRPSSSRPPSSRSSSSRPSSSTVHISPIHRTSSRSSRRQDPPTRRTSIQSMQTALPTSGPERLRAARALLAELEKYEHLQRRSLLRNLPPLQFHITVERPINGRVQETEIEVSMNELRDQLQDILREESAHNSPLPPAPTIGGLRHIKSTSKGGIKDTSVFPTHTYDGRALPSEKTACTICIEDYVEGDEIKSIPCLHFFHTECIDEWFKRSKCCPNCNVSAGD